MDTLSLVKKSDEENRMKGIQINLPSLASQTKCFSYEQNVISSWEFSKIFVYHIEITLHSVEFQCENLKYTYNTSPLFCLYFSFAPFIFICLKFLYAILFALSIRNKIIKPLYINMRTNIKAQFISLVGNRNGSP